MEEPQDPNIRKQDLLSCPRWILTTLQRERQGKRDLEVERENLHSQIQQLLTANQESQLINKKLQIQLQLKETEQPKENFETTEKLSLMERQLFEKNEEIFSQNKQIELLKQQMQVMQTQVEKKDEITLLLKQQLTSFEQTSSNQLIELKRKLTENMSRIQELEDNIFTKETEINQKEILNNYLTEEVAKLKEYMQKQQQNKENSSSRVFELEERISILEKENIQKEKIIIEFSHRLQQTEEELAQSNQKLRIKTEELVKLNEWVKEIQERKAKSDEKVKEWVEQKNQTITDLMDQNAKLKNQINSINSKLSGRPTLGINTNSTSIGGASGDSNLNSNQLGGSQKVNFSNNSSLVQNLAHTSAIPSDKLSSVVMNDKKRREKSMSVNLTAAARSTPNSNSSALRKLQNNNLMNANNISNNNIPIINRNVETADWIIATQLPNIKPNTFQQNRKDKKSNLKYPQATSSLLPVELFKGVITNGVIENLLIDNTLENILSKFVSIIEPQRELDILIENLLNAIYISDPIRVVEIIEISVKTEIEKAERDVNTLFRGNSFSSKMMSKYTRLIGLNYIKETIAPSLLKFSEIGGSYEVNPTQLAPSENLEENIKRLKDFAQIILDNILDSFDKMPFEFRVIAGILGEQVKLRFPQTPYFGVIGFTFLRCYCVAVATPLAFDIKDAKLDAPAFKRGRLLASKILQNLANGAAFKEDFMSPLNEWVERNSDRVIEFYEKLMKKPENSKEISLFSKPLIPRAKEFYLSNISEMIGSWKLTEKFFLSISEEKNNLLLENYQKLAQISVKDLFLSLLRHFKENGKIFKENDPITLEFLHLISTNESILSAITEEAIKNLTSQSDREKFSDSLYGIFHFTSTSILNLSPSSYWPLFLKFISDIEVDISSELLPSSLTSKLLTKIALTVELSHIRRMVATILSDFLSGEVLEIDEERLNKEDRDNLHRNVDRLIELLTKHISFIITALQSVFPKFFFIFIYLFLIFLLINYTINNKIKNIINKNKLIIYKYYQSI